MTTAHTRMAIPESYHLPESNWRIPARTRRTSGVSKPYLTTLVMITADLLSACLAIGISSWFVRLVESQHLFFDNHSMVLWLMGHATLLVLLVTSYTFVGLYPPVGLTWAHELRQVMISTGLVFGAVTVLMLLLMGKPAGTSWFLLTWLNTSLCVGLGRVSTRLLCGYQDWWGLPVVVYGPMARARKTVRNLQDMPWLGLRPVCVLDDENDHDDTAVADSAPGVASSIHPNVFGFRSYYGEESYPHDLDRIRGVPIVRSLADMGTAMSYIYPLSVDAPGLTARLLGLKLINRYFVKRFFDVSLALLMLLAATPLFILLALLVKVDSQGPVFFTQERPGKNGTLFKIYKFRTMKTNTPKEMDQLESEMQREFEQFGKIKNDPRVTRVGHWLRKFSLDELPQIRNILKGDMSLVGPRPYLVSQLARWAHSRKPSAV